MNAPTADPKLVHRIDRADKVIKYGVIGVVMIMVTLLVIILGQLFVIQAQIKDNITENKLVSDNNHALTRQYVRCLAENMLKPAATLSPQSFERCGINARGDTTQKKTDNSGGVTASPSMDVRNVRPLATRETTGNPPTITPPGGGSEAEPERPPIVSQVLEFVTDSVYRTNDTVNGIVGSVLGKK